MIRQGKWLEQSSLAFSKKCLKWTRKDTRHISDYKLLSKCSILCSLCTCPTYTQARTRSITFIENTVICHHLTFLSAETRRYAVVVAVRTGEIEPYIYFTSQCKSSFVTPLQMWKAFLFKVRERIYRERRTLWSVWTTKLILELCLLTTQTGDSHWPASPWLPLSASPVLLTSSPGLSPGFNFFRVMWPRNPAWILAAALLASGSSRGMSMMSSSSCGWLLSSCYHNNRARTSLTTKTFPFLLFLSKNMFSGLRLTRRYMNLLHRDQLQSLPSMYLTQCRANL